ncbi:hypothetical protein ACTJKZ_14830 [Pantoea sp. 22096]|uniref:hypothetical protein n=1 Tax=Pantoea sp. 22096 TaxID=3453873 RepID=UPI003F84FAC3
MNIDEVKQYLETLKVHPELLNESLSSIDSTINKIILAEKKYSYGLEKTTTASRQSEIERIVLQGFEDSKNENKTN